MATASKGGQGLSLIGGSQSGQYCVQINITCYRWGEGTSKHLGGQSRKAPVHTTEHRPNAISIKAGVTPLCLPSHQEGQASFLLVFKYFTAMSLKLCLLWLHPVLIRLPQVSPTMPGGRGEEKQTILRHVCKE